MNANIYIHDVNLDVIEKLSETGLGITSEHYNINVKRWFKTFEFNFLKITLFSEMYDKLELDNENNK